MLSGLGKRVLAAAFAALAVLLAPAGASAAPKHKLKAAYAVDRDGDGHVDGVQLKWSRKLRGGADRKAPFAFKVKGYKVTRVGKARGKKQLVRVKEKRACDTGASVVVRWKRRKLDMRRFDPAVPRITCAVTGDADGDARIDSVRLTYSRKVRSRAQKRGKFLFSVVGYSVKRVGRARGRFLRINLAERADPDSGATPIVGYSRPRSKRKRRYAVRAGRRAGAFTGSFQGTRDGVAPMLLAATTGDGDKDGLLDTMAVRFSEPVTAARPDALGVLGMKVRSATPFGKNFLGLALAESTARGDARPGVWITGTGVRDAAGNEAKKGAVAPADGAPPVIVGAMTVDSGGQPGRIDAIRVGFSEPVVHARDAGGAYPFDVAGRKLSAVEAATGREVVLGLVEGTSADSGATPIVSYTAGAQSPVTDAAGNPAVAASEEPVDGVAPLLLSATTGDGDANGRLDTVGLAFSEPVTHSPEASQSSFTVAGYTVADAAAASGSGLSLALTETGAADTGARPAVAYKRDGIADVSDAAGNLAADSALAQAADGAAPLLLAVRTADLDDDARIDALTTTWSEPLATPADSAAPFPVSASGFAVQGLQAPAGATLTVELVEPAGHDTGSTPALAYEGGSDPLRDAAGNEPAKKTYAGLTADALAPRMVAASTEDADGDGSLDGIDVRFSESVLHARETAQASFAASGYTVTSAEEAAQEKVVLKLQEAGGGDSGARPAVSYTPDAQEDVRDGAANLAPAGTILQAADGARPVLLSAATQDRDDDGKLDGVTTSWSEPLDHPDDQTAPFPVSAESFAITRVRAASANDLDVDLAEPAAADTGSAPDLTYLGGGDPVRDAAGLEPEQKGHDGLTRDALPPRLVSSSTADVDLDGRLDAVDLNWSEDVTGATGSGPFQVVDAVDGAKTLGANVSFAGPRTRVPFTEDGSAFDTDERPTVAYDDGPGDLRDLAEGAGDVSEDAPAVAAETPADKAAPILVAAKTADLSPSPATPNGTLDAVLVTFSEPISHAVDGIAPFSLNVAGRNEIQVEGDTGGGDKSLYVTLAEHSSPDGGFKPNVTVVTSGPDADRIKDRATPSNDAHGMTFTGTADEVRPVLLSAQLGERGSSGGCTKDPVDGIDGQTDCVITTWSEPVTHASDSDGTYPLASSGWAIDAGGIAQLGPSSTLEILLDPAATPDRDRAGTSLAYDEAEAEPVLDAAGTPNQAISGSKPAEPACKDTGLEGNDTRAADNPELDTTAPSFQRKCAFDDDWYRADTTGAGYLELLTRPAGGVDVAFELVNSSGTTVAPTQIVETGAAGEIDRRKWTGLAGSAEYWLRVSATDSPSPQEGPYCVVFSDDPAIEAGCGPLVGQLVFTEAGIGNDKFIEFKNDFDVPVEMEGAGAKLILGAERRECTLILPTGAGESVVNPGEHVLIQQTESATAFGCDEVNSLAPGGERLELSANGAIDVVDLSGVLNSPVAAEHSLQFVEDDVIEDADANNDVTTKWCRTFAADTKAAAGDGCDEYRINEVLWRPTSSSGSSDGRAFLELAGNLPALADSELLGAWIVRGINGLTGAGTADFVLPADASPRANGTYVVADGVAGVTQVSVSDQVWNSLDLNDPNWPDATGVDGPRGLQLLRPGAGGSPPCTSSADAFGWTSTAQGFTHPLDDMRSCPALEGQEYTNGSVGSSAARDNLSSAGDTTYNTSPDSGQNRGDFCPQAAPNPGQLNIRPSC